MCYDDVSRNLEKRNPAFKKPNLFIYDHGMGVCGWIWNVSVKRQRICLNISGSDAHFVNSNRCIAQKRQEIEIILTKLFVCIKKG